MPSSSPASIAAALSVGDPRLAAFIELVGPPPSSRAIPVDRRFDGLAVAILHQQLAGKAAATITGRTRVAD